ncbi:MAG: type II secretion system protein GspL [Gammaproteobacteria bacterium]|nr:type II secretion system protein GspL [Gammaproteobacteria bacterium]
MMFILQLHSDQTSTWFEINDDGEIISSHLILDLFACPKINSDANLVVLIPGMQVLMTTVKLPKMRASERARAIPFAIEEQLAGDPENISVITGDTQNDGALNVAIFEKEFFEAVSQQWQAMALHPKVVLPDYLALLLEPETWSVALQNKIALVRIDKQNGFSVDIDNLFLFLQLALEKNKDKKPKKINFWQEDSVINVVQLETLGIPIHVLTDVKKTFFDIKSLSEKPTLNFLQGKYRPKSESSSLQKNWMVCGAIAASFIAFLFLSNITQWIYFHHQSNKLQNQVLQVYQSLFPGARSVLEPRFRVATLLKKYEGASSENVFLHLYASTGEALLHFPDITAQSISFDQEQLQLTVQAKNLQLLSQLSQALREKRLHSSQQVLKNVPNDVSAEITIK